MAKTRARKAPKDFIAFRIPPQVHKQLHAYKEATGMPLQMQVNRALQEWLAALGLWPVDGTPFVRPAYPDLPGGVNHPQQFGKAKEHR